MTTIAVSPNTVFGILRASDGYWDRVWNRAKEMFERFTGMLEPYFGPPSLDYLDPKFQSTLSMREKATINGELLLAYQTDIPVFEASFGARLKRDPPALRDAFFCETIFVSRYLSAAATNLFQRIIETRWPGRSRQRGRLVAVCTSHKSIRG